MPFEHVGRNVECTFAWARAIVQGHEILRENSRHTRERLLIDSSFYNGASTDRVIAPPPLERIGRRLAEICAMRASAGP